MQVVVVGGLGKRGSENDVEITCFNVLRGLGDRRGGLTCSKQRGHHMQLQHTTQEFILADKTPLYSVVQKFFSPV